MWDRRVPLVLCRCGLGSREIGRGLDGRSCNVGLLGIVVGDLVGGGDGGCDRVGVGNGDCVVRGVVLVGVNEMGCDGEDDDVGD